MTLSPQKVRVLDLSHVLAGPYCSMILADFGLEVIKIEEPQKGDLTRSIGPYFINGISAYYLSVNRNKKSITLNLKKDEGRETFYKLVEKSDVVLDNFRPGVLERLKCSYHELCQINPRIICCSITGFGSTGPYRDRDLPSNDLVIQAMSGAMSLTGFSDKPPARMGIPYGDLAAGLFGAIGILAALFKREHSHHGEVIDISMLDCQVSLLTYIAQSYLVSGIIPGPIGSGHQWYVPYQTFATKDSYLVIAVFNDKFWKGLCEAIDVPEYIEDPRFITEAKRYENKEILIDLLSKNISNRETSELVEKLWEYGVTAGPVNNIAQTLSDPQIIARNMISEQVTIQGKTTRMINSPIRSSFTSEIANNLPPSLGEHTSEVLTELLGYNLEDIDRMRRNAII